MFDTLVIYYRVYLFTEFKERNIFEYILWSFIKNYYNVIFEEEVSAFLVFDILFSLLYYLSTYLSDDSIQYNHEFYPKIFPSKNL